MAHLDEHELLSDRQHTFRKWHSCETHLTTVIYDWEKILDKKGQVDTFVLDFENSDSDQIQNQIQKRLSILLTMNSLKANCLAME